MSEHPPTRESLHRNRAARRTLSAGAAPTLTLSLALALALAGCREAPTPTPQAGGEELWRQGQSALKVGELDRAGRLLEQSLAQADDLDRRTRASLQLACAGRWDLAERLLNEPGAPAAAGRASTPAELARLRRAMALFRAEPPPGQQDNPFVIAAMAEALRAMERDGAAVEAAPVRFSGDTLARLLRTWQAWVRLAEWERSGGGEEAEAANVESERAPEPPARVLAVWRLAEGQALRADPRHFVVHPRAEAEAGVLAYVGGWGLGQDGPGLDAVALADEPLTGPAEVRLSVARGERELAGLTLAGELDGQGLVVRAVSDGPLFAALLAVFSDEGLSGEGVTPRTPQEADELLRLAGALHPDRPVVQVGQALAAAAQRGETDYAPDTQWLVDIGSYVRYGRAALSAPAPGPP